MSAKKVANDMGEGASGTFFAPCDDGLVFALAIASENAQFINEAFQRGGVPVESAMSDNGLYWAFVVRVDPANPNAQSKAVLQRLCAGILDRLQEKTGIDYEVRNLGILWGTLADYFATMQ